VSEITDRLWEDYQAFITADLSEINVAYLFVDAIFEALWARRERGIAGRLVNVDPRLKCPRSSDYAGSLSWNDPQASWRRAGKVVK